MPSVTNPNIEHFKFRTGKDSDLGLDIYIGCSKTHICPVLAMSNYKSLLKDRPQSMPLFIFSNGSLMTKTLFIKQVPLLLISCGISPNQYSGHSFRVGGATDAASSGLQDWELKVMGRWTREAYHRYIRTPQSHLIGFTRRNVEKLHGLKCQLC